MTYAMGSSVRIGASVSLSANSKIIHYVRPDDDMIQFVFGDRDELELDMTEAGLRAASRPSPRRSPHSRPLRRRRGDKPANQICGIRSEADLAVDEAW